MLVPHNVYDRCMMFRVDTMASILNDHYLFVHVSDRCKPPDHSILTIEFSLQSDPTIVDPRPDFNVEQRNIPTSKRFRFQNMPEDFMTSPMWQAAINELYSTV